MKKLHRVALVATMAGALGACGEEDGGGRPPVATIEDPPAYFGLEPCTCYEYVLADGSSPLRLGVAVERVANVFSSPGEEPEHLLVFRRNATVERVDGYRFDGNDLVLVGTQLGGPATGVTWTANPPMVYLRAPVDRWVEQSIEQTVTFRQPGTDTVVEANPSVSFAQFEVQVSVDGGEPQPVTTYRTRWQGLPWSEPRRFFAPEQGWLQIEMENEQGSVERWVLRNKRTLGDGCPWPIDTTPRDICGASN